MLLLLLVVLLLDNLLLLVVDPTDGFNGYETTEAEHYLMDRVE